MKSGTVSGSIYGGGAGGSSALGYSAVDNAEIVVSGGDVTGTIYGGGSSGDATGNASIEITGGEVNDISLGGAGGAVVNSTLKISGADTVVNGNITADSLSGDAEISITGTAVNGITMNAEGNNLLINNGRVEGEVSSDGALAISGKGVFTQAITAAALTAADGLNFEVSSRELAKGALVKLTGGEAGTLGAVTIKVTDGDISSFDSAVLISGNVSGVELTLTDGTTTIAVEEGTTETVLVNSEWSNCSDGDIVVSGGRSYRIGSNAFGSFLGALQAASANTSISRIEVQSDISEQMRNDYEIKQDLAIVSQDGKAFTVDVDTQGTYGILINGTTNTLTIAEGIEIRNLRQMLVGYYSSPGNLVVNGKAVIGQFGLWARGTAAADSVATINAGAEVAMTMGDGQVDLQVGTLNVNGNLSGTTDAELAAASQQLHGGYFSIRNAGEKILNLTDTYVSTAWLVVDEKAGKLVMTLDNSVFDARHDNKWGISFAGTESQVALTNGSRMISDKIAVKANNVLMLESSSVEVKAGNLQNEGTINVSGTSALASDVILGGNGKIVFGTVNAAADVTFDRSIDGSSSDQATVQVLNGKLTLASGANINLKGRYSSPEGGFILGTLDRTQDDGSLTAVVTVEQGATLVSKNFFWVGSANGSYETPETQSGRFTLIVDGGTVDASSNSFTVRNTGKIEIRNGGSLTAYDGSIRNEVLVTGEGSMLTFGGNVYGESPSGENGAPVYGTASIVVDNGAAARFTGLVIGGNGSGRANRRGTLEVVNADVTADTITLSAANEGEEARSSIHMENGRLTVGTLVNNGTFAMDYNSTLTFGSFTNAGTFSISLDGYCGGEKKLLLDYTGSETLTGEYYSKLLGSSWNDACFTVENNDLYLNYDSAVVVYVNSTYSEENCGGHTWGVDAFADHESAMAKNPVRVVSCGGEFSSTVALNSKEGQIDGGTYKPLLAGHLVNTDVKNWDDHEGHLTVRINDGTFTSNVIGADGVAGGSSERTGNVSMTIDGGTFSKQVAGGMYLAHTDSRGSVILTGDIDLTISGGTFDGRIYGGNFGINDTVSGRMSMKGNINLTIDAGKALTVNEHISAGSRGRGTVDGNVTVTVTGNGDNLTFDGLLFGGCSGDLYRTNNGVRTADTSVTGDRKLVFDGFSNGFDGTVSMFESVRFAGGSSVAFTNAALNLSDISNWDFEFGSSLSGVNRNNFAGDTLNFDLTGWAGDQWEVMSGSASAFSGWNDASRVTLGGESAAWDSDISGWCSSNYQLTLEEDGDGRKWIIAGKLA